jgi:predicted SnoaL-like aldol condensation-catalyzing enzyme
MTEHLERNKSNVLAFYDPMFNQCQPAAAVAQYVGDVYIQHNPGVADGKEAFIAHFRGMEHAYPGKRAHVVRVIAEGHYVVVHVHTEWPGSISSGSMTTARLWNIGMCSRSCPSTRPMRIRCSDAGSPPEGQLIDYQRACSIVSCEGVTL